MLVEFDFPLTLEEKLLLLARLNRYQVLCRLLSVSSRQLPSYYSQVFHALFVAHMARIFCSQDIQFSNYFGNLFLFHVDRYVAAVFLSDSFLGDAARLNTCFQGRFDSSQLLLLSVYSILRSVVSNSADLFRPEAFLFLDSPFGSDLLLRVLGEASDLKNLLGQCQKLIA